MGKSIENLKQSLVQIRPFHPGKITQQYIRCGKKNCKCRDEKNPIKHGPYHLLSYNVGKKNSTVFLKAEELQAAQEWLRSYEEFNRLTQELTQSYVALAKKKRWKI